MPQAIIFFEPIEDHIIIKYSHLWNLSKNETVKRIVREFDKLMNGIFMK